MAYLLRLIALALCLSAGGVHALLPQVPYYYVDIQYGKHPTREAACLAKPTSTIGPGYSFNRVYQNGTDWFCEWKTAGGTNFTLSVNGPSTNGGGACPANSTPSGGACVCTPPLIEGSDATAGTCVSKPDDCVKLAGKAAGSKEWWGRGESYTFCDGWNTEGGGHCVAVASKGLTWEDRTVPAGDPHRFRSSGEATYTGTSSQSCNGDGVASPGGSTPTDDGKPPAKPKDGEAAPAPCPPGQAAGEVNGQRVCAPLGSDVPKDSKESSEKKNPDGSTTRTDEETRCNGVKCEKDTRVCKKTADGLETCETTTSTSDQSGFCTKGENKGNKVCQGQGEGTPSGFGGNCDAGFMAKGDDAVLNAMAQEQYKRNCELLRTDKEPSTWLAAEGQKTGDRTGDNPNNGTVSIGPGNFDTSDALGGGGGCNLNKTISVRGYSVALPFNVLCDPLAVLGQILVAVSMLLAARIVTRG